MKTSNEMAKPTSKWDVSKLLYEDLYGNLYIQTSFGVKGSTQTFASLKIKSSKYAHLNPYAFESLNSCMKQMRFGKKLTEECTAVRSYATSLDKFETIVTIPSMSDAISSVSQNVYFVTFTDFCAAFISPYVKSRRTVQPSGDKNQITIFMEIQPRGDLMNMKVKGIGSEIVMENIRIPAQVRGYFPIIITFLDLRNLSRR